MTTTTAPFKDLTLPNFSSLLNKLQLATPDTYTWDQCWSLLSCSKLYLRGFAKCKVDDITVIYDKNNNFSDLSCKSDVSEEDDNVFLFKKKGSVIVRYPCAACSREVDDTEEKKSGQELQCSRCMLYFHNQCTSTPISKEFRKLLASSPEYVQTICPPCMKSECNIKALHKDIGVMKDIAASRASYLTVTTANSQQPVGRQIIQEVIPAPHSTVKAERDARTRVVLKPLDVKCVSSRNIKGAMNKKYKNEIFLENCFATAGGSFVLEMESKEMAEKLDNTWDNALFGGNSGLTKLTSPTDNCVGVIKDIDDDGLTEEELVAEIKRALPLVTGSVVEVFKSYSRRTRKKEFTGTVKFTCSDRASLEEAVKSKIMINNQRVKVEEWVQRRKPKYCYICLSFGHVSHRCRSRDKQKCGKCSAVNHQTKDCSISDPNRFKCGHCGGKHAAGSIYCPTMKEECGKQASRQHHG